MHRLAFGLALLLGVGCSNSDSGIKSEPKTDVAPAVNDAAVPSATVSAPIPVPRITNEDLPAAVGEIDFTITKAAIVKEGSGEAVEIEYERIAKAKSSHVVVVANRDQFWVHEMKVDGTTQKGKPIRFVPAGAAIRSIRGPVMIWTEQESFTQGQGQGLKKPEFRTSEIVEATRVRPK